MYGGYYPGTAAVIGSPAAPVPGVIERAVYGVPGGQEADVTTTVREEAAGKDGVIRADNGTLRGDPAPYCRKRLAVWVSGVGVIEAWEGETLRIPRVHRT
jgi:hypothetical protein